MKRHEGLVGGIILIVAAALALMLSGCENSEVAWSKVQADRREAGFAQCAKFCGAKPGKTTFNEYGHLLTCRCDTNIIESVEVE